MRDHHRHEVGIDVAARLDLHADHHLRHRPDILGEERCFSRRAERNPAVQIAVMYSARDGASLVLAKTVVAVAMRRTATATELRRNCERVKRSMSAPLLTRRAVLEQP